MGTEGSVRRVFGVLAIGVLLASLWPAIAAAQQPVLAAPSVNLSKQIFRDLFGEAGDHRASLVAESGNALGESPLREFAFHVSAREVVHASAAPSFDLPDLSDRIYALATFARPPLTLSDPSVAPHVIAPHAPLVGYYHPERPEPSAAPETFDFPRLTRPGLGVFADPQSRDVVASVNRSSLTSVGHEAVSPQVRVGRVRLQTHVESSQSGSSPSALSQSLGGGATIDVRAGSRQAAVDVSSRFEHVTMDAPVQSGSSFDATANWVIGVDGVPMLAPMYADVNRQTLSAGLAVPVFRNLTANVRYDQEHLFGGYGSSYGISSLDARNDVYGAALTFQLPHSASAISLSAKQYRYQDNIVSQNAFTQTSAGLNFTVKF
jgi:hypothetical protein